jgi:hypothetical protein
MTFTALLAAEPGYFVHMKTSDDRLVIYPVIAWAAEGPWIVPLILTPNNTQLTSPHGLCDYTIQQ